MSKYLLAVSGGIDSVVLLDLFFHTHQKSELIIAHFDHHLRNNSHEDYLFVEHLAQKYDLPFFGGEATLKNSSESVARTARYSFLFALAQKHDAMIVTAHHLDDLVESIAINLLRGTGWRGLAVLNREGILRPFLDLKWSKKDIYKYAATHHLTFREDPTNSSDIYLRNRLRTQLVISHSQKNNLYNLRNRQISIANEIGLILSEYTTSSELPRSLFTNLGSTLADELLRSFLERHGEKTTLPTRLRLLSAIKTYPSNKKFNLEKNHFITFTKSTLKL